MSESGNTDWGIFRRPALLGPVVGFLAYLAAEAVRLPAGSGEGGGSADWIIWLGLILLIVYVFSAIPYLLGAFLLLAACRALPTTLVRLKSFRVVLGALVGGLLAWPFAHALNWIPSATTTEPRFSFVSLLIACAISGGFCAAFLSLPHPARSA